MLQMAHGADVNFVSTESIVTPSYIEHNVKLHDYFFRVT